MALNQTLAQLRASARKCADIEGTSATSRHPDADVNDYVNRGLAALYRLLTLCDSGQRYLSSQIVNVTSGTSGYTLDTTFAHLISAEATIEGSRIWLLPYMPGAERAILSDSALVDVNRTPSYRLEGGSITFLPVPASTYTVSLWFVPAAPQLANDATVFDTVQRLDDYIIWHAAREIGTKDKQWDLVRSLDGRILDMRGEIENLARHRDQNAPQRIVDITLGDRYGRRRYIGTRLP